MRFWDASAVVPLVLPERQTKAQAQALLEDPRVVVWWATRVEAASAIRRRERQGAETGNAMTLLSRLAEQWHEVPPSENIRAMAERLLAVHALRAADAPQLAAAMAWRRDLTRPAALVCLDERLRDAAAREGFDLVPAGLGS